MRNVIASEWVKLRRKGMLAALAAGVVVTVLGTVISVLTAGDNISGRGGIGGASSVSIVQLTSSHGFGVVLANAGTLLGVITLGVVAASVAGEFSNGTLRNLLVREPRRSRLLLGKLAGLACAITVAVVLAAVVALLGGALAASSSGYSVDAWFSAAGIGSAIGAVLQLIVATLGWGAFGAVLGVAFRSPVIAIVIGVVYALPLESVLGNISNGVARWLPGKLLAAVAAGGDSTVSLTAALFTFIVYAIVALGGTVWLFARRDVAM